MKRIHMSAVTIILLSIAAASSYAISVKSLKLKKPKIAYEKFEVKKVTVTDTTVDFIYSVDNPNPVGLKNISAHYNMYLGYTKKPANTPPFTRGTVEFDVKAKGVSPFILPMTVNYKGFFKSTAKLARAVLGGQKTIPFVLETTFVLDIKVLKFSIPVETEGELPLPDVKGKILD